MFVFGNTESNAAINYKKTSGTDRRLAKAVIIIVSVILVTLICLFSYMLYFTKGTERIVGGVYYGQANLGHMSRYDAEQYIKSDLTARKNAFLGARVLAGDRYYNISDEELTLTWDAENTAHSAYIIARSGNVLEDVVDFYITLLKGRTITPKYSYDALALNEFVDRMAAEIHSDLKQPVWDKVFYEGRHWLFITAGCDARQLEKDSTLQNILAAIDNPPKDWVVVGDVTITPCDAPDLKSVRAEIFEEPKDAAIVVNQGGEGGEEISIENEIIGIDMDVAAATELLYGAQPGETVRIPLVVTTPQITYEHLKSKIFADTLSKYSTKLNTSLVSRTHNVDLAAQKINGTILNPGEVFSFNKTVGKRTYEAGFRDAKIYMKDSMVDDVGGGICQVTSTLYAASLFADMETVERHNHRFTVSYIKLGYDATVFYGSLDFRFKNSSPYPIKVLSNLSGNTLTIEIKGTKTEDKEVELSGNSYDRVEHGEKVIVDSTMAPGTRKVDTQGTYGITVDTYKTVKVDGVETSRIFLHKSKYVPCDTVILVGPEPPAPKPEPKPDPGPGPDPEPEPTVPTHPVFPGPEPKPEPDPGPEPKPDPKPDPAPDPGPQEPSKPPEWLFQ